MIAWFKKLFYIPKYGKVEECTMTARAVLTLCTVIAGLAAMGFSAYAYFSSTVSSGFTNITAATFQTVLTVQFDDENGAPVELHPGAEQTKWVELSKDQTYYIHIQRTPESTANTGFVIVTVAITTSLFYIVYKLIYTIIHLSSLPYTCVSLPSDTSAFSSF